MARIDVAEEKLRGLYQIAKENDIDVYENCPEKFMGVAIKYPNGKKIISLYAFETVKQKVYNEKRNRSYTKLGVFAHEIGHFLTDSFYYGKESNSALICTQEAKADIWAFKYVIPFEELCEAVKEGYTSYEDLEFYFKASRDFIIDAITYYAAQNKFIYP